MERDGWRCRRCGRRDQLDPHHNIKRSDLHIDAAWNLITLCRGCHQAVEDGDIKIIGSERVSADTHKSCGFNMDAVVWFEVADEDVSMGGPDRREDAI